MAAMRIAFIGTVEFSWHCLDEMLALGANVVLAAYVDPAHARSISDYRPLDDLCRAHGVPTFTFRRIGDGPTTEALRAARPEVVFVLGLSQLLPESLLALPPAGVIGSHPALLPANRGRALIPWSILLHHARGGLSLFYLTPEVDAGDLIAQASWPITRADTATTLYAKMTAAGRQLLRDYLPAIIAGTAPRIPQDHTKATYLPKRTPADGRIDWSRPAESVYDLIRATTHPYPGAFTLCGERKVIVWKAREDAGREMRKAECGRRNGLNRDEQDAQERKEQHATDNRQRTRMIGHRPRPATHHPAGLILAAEGESVLVVCGHGDGVWLDLLDAGAGEQSPLAAGLRPGMRFATHHP
jgi:methionyl-tRNA formyltransferase